MSFAERGFIIVFFIISCFLYSDQLLDYYLNSRFLAASFLILLGILYLSLNRTSWESKQSGISHMSFIFGTFILLNFLSIIWAKEKSEALFSAQKWLLAGASYVVLTTLISHNRKEATRYIAAISLISTCLVLAIVSFRLIEIGSTSGFSNDSLYQLQTLFGHKSLISAFIFLLLPLNMLALQEEKSWLILFILFWQILVILILQSRTVYLCLIVLAMILIPAFYVRIRQIGRISWKQLWLPLVLTVVGVVLLAQIPDLKDRLNIGDYFKSQTATERQLVWLKTKPLIADHWLLGVGGGNWKIQFPGNNVEGSYRMQDQNVFFTRAHNDFLEIFAELGVLGLLLYLSLFFHAVFLLYQTRKQHPWIASMLGAGILGFMLISFIDFPKERPEFVLLLAMYLAIAQSHNRKNSQIKVAPVVLKSLWLLIAAGLVFNLISGYGRYKGESFTKKLLQARVAEDWDRVISLTENAENTWHHLDPSSVPISFYTGVAYYNLNEKEQARQWFLKAHKIAPYNFHVLNNLATVEIDGRDYESAILWLDEALRINSRFEDALFNLAYCYTQTGDFHKALDVIDQVPSDSDKKKLFRSEINKRMSETKTN
ncbi:MAG: tetratricopeptide repeat protein [Saprospiraceae bacterium]|nr:tetratricopeptide repeat protein [Saprospiraceae bacterium]